MYASDKDPHLLMQEQMAIGIVTQLWSPQTATIPFLLKSPPHIT